MKIQKLLSEVKELSEMSHKDEDILNIVEKNKDFIVEKLAHSNEEYIEALQILSIQCLTLADNKEFLKLKDELPFVLQKWDQLPFKEERKMRSNMYEKLLFHKMNLDSIDKKWESALKTAKTLMKYHPDKEVYINWKINIDKNIDDERKASLGQLKSLSVVVKIVSVCFLIGIWFFGLVDEWSKTIKIVLLISLILIIVILEAWINKKHK